jgi:superoxide dismutase, Fe-Mn family
MNNMNNPFEEKKFDIPALQGISAKNIEEHLKLYAGYVKNANSILEKIPEYQGYAAEDPFAPYASNELGRRFSFEYNGMRNHEVYFSHFEGGAQPLPEGALKAKISETWGSYEAWLEKFKAMAATTRGIGWAVLWYDKKGDRLMNGWMDEQHLGLLNECSMVIALDMWEHSYVADYQPSGKKQYVEDFFANLNWKRVEESYLAAKS